MGVKERSIMGQLLTIAKEIADSVYFPENKTSKEIIIKAEQKISILSNNNNNENINNKGPTAAKTIIPDVIEKIDKLMQNKGNITGISTSYKDLDNLTSGLQKSDLIIIAGR